MIEGFDEKFARKGQSWELWQQARRTVGLYLELMETMSPEGVVFDLTGEKYRTFYPLMNPKNLTFARTRKIYSQERIALYLGKDIRTIRRWEKDATKIPQMAESALRELLNGKAFEAAEEEEAKYATIPDFTFIDLFAGIGGTRIGFEEAGGRCVFTSEWDKYACQTYRLNHHDSHEIEGDITKIHSEDIPDHDVLVAGFPCQPFSLAGVSKKNSLGRVHGFLDATQGTLFFDIARIISAKRPRAFLLENVKNLRSHDKGKTYTVIIKALRELGYTVHDRIIDGACMVPQHRERIYIVGFRENEEFDWDALHLPDPENGPKLCTVLHSPDEEVESHYTEKFKGKTQVAPKYTLSDHMWNYLQGYAAKHRLKGNGFGCSVVGPGDIARTLSSRYHKDGSEILIRQKGKNPRRLTPRECARLMGFPEDFKIEVSDTQAYRQFGNSVIVPVIREVANGISASLAGKPLQVDPSTRNQVYIDFGNAWIAGA